MPVAASEHTAVIMKRPRITRLLCFIGVTTVIVTMVWIQTNIISNVDRADPGYIHVFNRHQNTANTTFPNKFHQIWFNYSAMPKQWEEAIRESRERNKDATYYLWSKADVEKLLLTDYPWFMETYKSYTYDIQRVDAVRYFILHKHGGFYMDMDIQSRVSFMNLVDQVRLSHHDTILHDTEPNGVSNDFVAAKQNSRFMGYLISRLESCNKWYGVPYLTVLMSTGPLFVTRRLANYDLPQTVYVMDEESYLGTYFSRKVGSTWHRWDGKLITKIWLAFTNKYKWVGIKNE